MENKDRLLLGMKPNICLGLAWLVLPFAIVVLCVKKNELYREEKEQIICSFVLAGVINILIFLGTILALLWGPLVVIFYLIALIPTAFTIFSMVRAFMNKYYQVPVAYEFAKQFVNFGADDKKAASNNSNNNEEEVVEAEIVE